MRLRCLPKEERAPFAGMTYPMYREALMILGDDRAAVIGADLGGMPIGLGFAVRFSAGFEIVSVWVTLDDSNGLLRGRLIRALMDEAKARGWRDFGIFHPSFDIEDKGLPLALRDTGWLGPRVTRLAAWTTVDKMLTIEFERMGDLRPGYAVVPWKDVDGPLRRRLRATSKMLTDDVRSDLDPLLYEERADQDLSFLLLRDGVPIGWHLPERFDSGRYRWTCSATAPGHWSMAAALILWKRALTAQRDTGVNGLIWGVPLIHRNMVRFVMRRLRPALDGLIVGATYATRTTF